MPLSIVDREAEQEELRQLSEAGAPRLALIYGRRRVGKTYLLTHLWGERQAFHFTAAAVTPEQNRRQLIEDFGSWSGQHLETEDYPTWRTVFRLLLTWKRRRSLVIVLDEFQYLGESERDLERVTSELNAAWEGLRGPARPLLLVLSGSAVRIMEALDAGGAPLHGRLAWKAQLAPFDYLDAAAMARFDDPRDRARAYGVFGGMPSYLAALDTGHSLGENVADLMLSPRGEIRNQVETALLQEQGLRDIPKYSGILRAIGAGRTILSDIGARAGLSADTSLRDKVERLVWLGYVQKQRNFGARATVPYRYRLADPAFMFYHEFVTRLESALQVNAPIDVWAASVEPQLDSYMGHLFERIAEQAYHRRRGEAGLPLVLEWGRWEGSDHAGESLEMDVVARLTSGDVLTGAVKWNRSPAGIRLHRNHLRDLDRLSRSGRRWAHQARKGGSLILYCAAGGFEPGFVERAQEDGIRVVAWSLEDLYMPGAPR